ncbi:hypothetical protein KSS87_000779, partial [Heliosperma pusillum]
ESKGITEEMRFVVMNLKNSKGSGRLSVDSQPSDENHETKVDAGDESSWQPSLDGFLKYLVDSKLVFDVIEDAYFRKTGLERSESLARDLKWFRQQNMLIPEPSSPGISYAAYLKELSQKSAPLFLCHFYNSYFSHIAGGQVIAKQVAEKLLGEKELDFYKWDNDAQELLKDVREKLNRLGEHWSRDDKNKCLKEATKSFREECECNAVRGFAIVSMQRSGSGWFETMLNSHINVSSNGEIFSVKERRSNASTILKTLDQVYNLDWFSSASKNECSAAVGLKWMLNQGLMAHHEEIVRYMNQKGVSTIFLLRKNLLRRMVSMVANSYDRDAKLLNGTHKSHVHSPVEAQLLASYKPKINVTELRHKLKVEEVKIAKALEYFNSTRHMIVYYEDLIANRTETLLKVQEFLRVPYRNLTSRQIKIHRGPTANQVENWDDIKTALNGTSHQSFLYDDYRR